MLNKLFVAWPKASKNDESLARLLRDVGHACASLEPESLRELRNHFATAKVKGDKAEGMLIATVEILDGLRDARGEWQQEVETYFERRDGLHMRILVVLFETGKATPKTLEAAIKAKRPTDVSAALKKLQKLGLVHEPVRGEMDARERFYRLTPRGREVVDKLELATIAKPLAYALHETVLTRRDEPALRANAAGPRPRGVSAKTIRQLNRMYPPDRDAGHARDFSVSEDRHSVPP